MKFTIAVGVIAAASCASAFVVPAAPVRSMTRVNGEGKYDGQLWDNTAKEDIKSLFDPSQPRSDTNFDPFVTDAKGNKCDSSGYFPGETRYKDPIRPAVSFAEYLKQKAEKDAAEGQ